MTGTNVKRADGVTWIDADLGFNCANYASSVHGAQAVILSVLGSDIGYDDLIGYSGFAFRVSVHEAMCPSAGHPCCGFACIEGSNRMLPWHTRVYDSFPWSEPKTDRAGFEAEVNAAVKASIDRGLPIHYSKEEDGLIVGYADEGRRWRCVHPYYRNGSEAFWFDEAEGFAGGAWPWVLAVWTEPKPAGERADPRARTVSALEQAARMWRAGTCEAYVVGEAAYARWLSVLEDIQAGRIEDPVGAMQGNGWCFDVLIHARRIAARWLARQAGLFNRTAAAKLAAAAGCYERLVDTCMADLDCPWDLAPHPSKKDAWTAGMRAEQISRLGVARDCDRAAVEAIDAALAALE